MHAGSHTEQALEVAGLRVETAEGVEIVADVSFSVPVGEILAVVGESGCGKTSVAMALLGHARRGTRIAAGSVSVAGTDILSASPSVLRRLRGNTISYVPQDPSASLSPRRKIASQMLEAMTIHGVPTDQARDTMDRYFREVQLPTTPEFFGRYPFELSGGQQQRVLIAMALACTPTAVVLDEPTTGLDVTTQAHVLRLLGELAERHRVAFVYVSHDLAVVEELADHVAVMYSGRIIETGSRQRLFGQPQHPYTTILLNSVPRISARHELHGIAGTTAQPGERPTGCFFRDRCPVALPRCAEEFPPAVVAHGDGVVRCYRAGTFGVRYATRGELPRTALSNSVLEVSDLVAGYGRGAEPVVREISFGVAAGECVALVGESGSGKSTTGRCIAGLHHPSAGSIRLHGQELAPSARQRTNAQLRALQIVFQNPDRSLNPSHTVRSLIERPLAQLADVRGEAAVTSVQEVLDRVRLSRKALRRYPGELSGGEKQRVAIARALAAGPSVLVCDEITSALDVSIQTAILELLDELREDGLSLLFITHNLGVVRTLAARTLVMERGTILEAGFTADVIDRPQAPYTQALLASALEIQTLEHEPAGQSPIATSD